jgi:hypothetical protein
MGKFINPFTDVGFKRIFGQEITKDLLIDFLERPAQRRTKHTGYHLPRQRTDTCF